MKKLLLNLKVVMTLLLLIGATNVWGDIVYTLTPAKGSNNSYAANCDVKIGDITWNITGNSTMIPWRLGGKSLSNVDRAVYSKTAFTSALSKIDLTIGETSGSITINSIKLLYSTNSDFSNSSELVASGTTTSTTYSFVPEGGFPANCYYKFVVNVTVSGTNNKYVEFSKVEFYGSGITPTKTLESIAVSGTPTKTEYTEGDTFDPAGLTVTGTYDDESTSDITNQANWTITPSTLDTETTSVKVTATVGSIISSEYTVNGISVSEIPEKTVAEFIEAEGGKCYLAGAVSNITNTTYGNFTLTDESGSIVVYGCLTPEGESKKFESLNIKVGNKIKVLADKYQLYNQTTDEAVNVIFVEKITVATEMYAIEIDDNIKNGTVEADAEEAAEGDEITLTATPATGYVFGEWYVLDGNANEVAVTNNKFIMPASNVTVSATFTAIPTHYVMYTSLGEEVGEGEDVYEGSCIANAPEVTAPEGWTFIGWTTNDEYTMSTTSPELFSASTPVTEDLILCAVFSKTEGGADSEPALVKMVSGDTFEDGDKIVIVAHDTEVALYRETVNTSYVNKYTFDENINTVLADEKNYVTVKAIEGGYALGIYPSSNNLYAQDDNVSDIWTLNDLKDGTFKIQSNERNLSYRSDLTNMYWRMGGANYGTSGKTVLDLYKVSTGIAGTTVYTIAAPQTYNVEITDAKYATLGLPYAVTIPEGVSAYVASAAEGNSVTMDALEGVIPANTGVVLYSETPATYTFTETAADEFDGSNLMVAVTEDGGKQIGGNGTDYVLALKDGAVKFYEANEGTIAQYKAYLQMSTAGVKELNINFNGGEANGIRTIISNDNAKTNAIYNLNGQRLNSLQKGLNIVNGKKVYVK